jgi:outer membrane protein
VVASYTLLAAVGRLTSEGLSMATETYDSGVHYNQVRDKWFGVRNPDGR